MMKMSKEVINRTYCGLKEGIKKQTILIIR